MRFFKSLAIVTLIILYSPSAETAYGLPQYKRLLEREYQFKTPCATCHSQGGGSSLSVYGKVFDKAGKSSAAIKQIASQIPPGDKLNFGAKLKAKANPNDPKSTPENPGDWAGGSGIPTDELKTFAPSEVTSFSILEGELKSEQIDKLKTKLGDSFQDEDKYPTFYFGEVNGKKTFVVQYVRLPQIKKTLGLVVNTGGSVVNLSFVGAKKGEVPAAIKEKFVGKKLVEIEAMKAGSDEETESLRSGVLRGLAGINAVFSKK